MQIGQTDGQMAKEATFICGAELRKHGNTGNKFPEQVIHFQEPSKRLTYFDNLALRIKQMYIMGQAVKSYDHLKKI